ncbi:hypothetical protein BUN20_22565 [Bacteroides fragilis]|nr:hypothetical protein BUN20_22565 [Bacteroides fragilis]
MIGFFLLTECCRTAEKNPRFYDAGVSKELADHRKAEIKNLKYELSFSIPRQKKHLLTVISPCASTLLPLRKS